MSPYQMAKAWAMTAITDDGWEILAAIVPDLTPEQLLDWLLDAARGEGAPRGVLRGLKTLAFRDYLRRNLEVWTTTRFCARWRRKSQSS